MVAAMTDEQFRSLCNMYGFAPSRSLRELLDTATSQAVIAEREACARVCDELIADTPDNDPDSDAIGACAIAIRARKDKQ